MVELSAMRKHGITLAILLTAGCATILGPNEESILFETDPRGERIRVDGTEHVTPAQISLATDRSHRVVWPDGSTSTIQRSLNGWFFANILLGGLIGMGIDLITGKVNANLEPEVVRWARGRGIVDPEPPATRQARQEQPVARYASGAVR